MKDKIKITALYAVVSLVTLYLGYLLFELIKKSIL